MTATCRPDQKSHQWTILCSLSLKPEASSLVTFYSTLLIRSTVTMIAPSSTPFKILGDENDSSVIKKSLKGAKTAEFSRRGGLSSFPDSTKATGQFSVTKSTRKPLLDLSKGQLNSRLTDVSAQQPNAENGAIRKRNSNSKMGFSIPIISSNKTRSVPISTKKSPPENNFVSMI